MRPLRPHRPHRHSCQCFPRACLRQVASLCFVLVHRTHINRWLWSSCAPVCQWLPAAPRPNFDSNCHFIIILFFIYYRYQESGQNPVQIVPFQVHKAGQHLAAATICVHLHLVFSSLSSGFSTFSSSRINNEASYSKSTNFSIYFISISSVAFQQQNDNSTKPAYAVFILPCACQASCCRTGERECATFC